MDTALPIITAVAIAVLSTLFSSVINNIPVAIRWSGIVIVAAVLAWEIFMNTLPTTQTPPTIKAPEEKFMASSPRNAKAVTFVPSSQNVKNNYQKINASGAMSPQPPSSPQNKQICKGNCFQGNNDGIIEMNQ